MTAPQQLSLLHRSVLALLAVGCFAVNYAPTRAYHAAVANTFGEVPYEGSGVLIHHVFLGSTLQFVCAALLWLVLNRMGWLAAPSLRFSPGVFGWGLLGGLVAAGITLGVLFLAQPNLLHPPEFEPWLLAANAVSNFYEEFIFRGFLLVALTAAFGFWPAAILSSVAFGVIHTQYAPEEQAVVALFGLIWAWIAHITKSLIAPYVSHMALDWIVDPIT